MKRLYRYVGPKSIARRALSSRGGVRIERPADVLAWIEETGQEADRSRTVVATFVVDADRALLVADRRTEHVACAGGRAVRSAGEMAFRLSPGAAAVAWVTNQSTGYCPEPDSWLAVKELLGRVGLAGPEGFDPAFVFRRCVLCGTTNVVRQGIFECAVCSAPLPARWNFDPTAEVHAPG